MRDATPDLKKVLTDFAASNMMSLGEMAQSVNMILKREAILQQHKSPISQNEKDRRWRTRLPNGKQLVKTRYEDLTDAIIEYYSNLPQETTVCGRRQPTPQKEAQAGKPMPQDMPPSKPTVLHLENHIQRMAGSAENRGQQQHTGR